MVRCPPGSFYTLVIGLTACGRSGSGSFSGFSVLARLKLLTDSLVITVVYHLTFSSEFSAVIFSSYLFSVLLFRKSRRLLAEVTKVGGGRFVVW